MGWMRMRIGGYKAENGGGAGAGHREGGDVRSWSTMKLREADVDKQDKHPPAQLRNPSTCGGT